ncbi:MAG: nucleotidyl transferase AbiEii/AbiGii toxin family protein [Usitatibacter sp.]
MKVMSHDFSTRNDLVGLARLTRSLHAVARPMEIEYFLMGAAARDLMLRYAHNIDASRATEDADFAVMVRGWDEYQKLREGLIASGDFAPRPGPATHRLRHRESLPLDIVPYGGVERRDRTIAWPGSEKGVVFDCFGMREASQSTVEVRLPEDVQLRVGSIPALAILKIAAWNDRKHTHPGRDASDLLLFARSYMDCDNFDRLISHHGDLLESGDFDHVEAGARLLARDLKQLLAPDAVDRVLTILLPEADEAGRLLLAHQSGMELELARRLLEVMCEELP